MIKLTNLTKRSYTAPSWAPRMVNVVQISYEKLTQDPDAALEVIDKAYSDNGLGTLAIKGIPGYAEKRRKALLLAWRLANLPREARQRLERPEHFYQVGWEHGEYGFNDGRDALMGSFFSNPLSDTFIGEDGNTWHNAWPENDLPQLRSAVVDLSSTMKGAAEHLSRHLDLYLRTRLPSFDPMYLQETVTLTPKVNSRLIHYYPCKEGFNGQWTGWHKDLGMLTCLTPALYTDKYGNEICWSDPAVGLHGQTKNGEVVKVNVPKDCMIVQIGEAMEILTGGVIKALPHAVVPLKHVGPGRSAVSRNTMALFIDPTPSEALSIPPERSEQQLFQCDHTMGLLTPKLQGRWKRGDTYGSFYLRSLAAYKQPAKNDYAFAQESVSLEQ